MLPVTVGVMSSCVKAELRDGLKDACASWGEILAYIVRKTLVSFSLVCLTTGLYPID